MTKDAYEDIVRDLPFDLMVQRGLEDSNEGRTISNEEMQVEYKLGRKRLDRDREVCAKDIHDHFPIDSPGARN